MDAPVTNTHLDARVQAVGHLGDLWSACEIADNAALKQLENAILLVRAFVASRVVDGP